MDNQQKHISEADYRRYLNGEMTGKERNAFEKLMQRYPFEAEALEGLREISADQLTRDMDELKQRLGRRVQKSNRMIWWAAAASMAILTASGILWYNLDQEVSDPQVAEHTMVEKLSEKHESDKGEVKSMIPATKSPEKEKAKVEGNNQLLVNPGEASDHAEAEVEDAVEITVAENDQEETTQVEVVESPVEISDAEISGSKPVSKPAPGPANEMIIVEDETIQNQTYEENVEMEFDFAEPNTTRHAKSITSGAAQAQINAPILKAQPMMEEHEFKAWLQSQAVLEPDAEMDSIVVLLYLFVDESGSITRFENANQADHKYFKKARKILRSGPPWQPAMINGVAIKSELELKVVFKK